MSNTINTESWSRVKIGELFDIHPTKAYKMSNTILLDNGIYPVIANSAYNNGIVGYTTQKPTEKGNIITFSDTTDANAIFYQEKPFVGYSHVQGMYPYKYIDKWNKYTLSFIATIFRKAALAQNYSYSNKFTRDNAKNITIYIPQTPSGELNWEYMESYMKDIEAKAIKKVEALKESAFKPSHQIDISSWHTFKIGGLFKINNGKYYNPKTLKESLKGIPYVTASTQNNGIAMYIKSISGTIPFPAGVLTWGKQSPRLFYQDKPFFTGQGTYHIDTQKLNKYAALFLATVINQLISKKYDYTNCLTGSKLADENILLPATSTGEPDWAYMESYMKDMEVKAIKRVEELKAL